MLNPAHFIDFFAGQCIQLVDPEFPIVGIIWYDCANDHKNNKRLIIDKPVRINHLCWPQSGCANFSNDYRWWCHGFSLSSQFFFIFNRIIPKRTINGRWFSRSCSIHSYSSLGFPMTFQGFLNFSMFRMISTEQIAIHIYNYILSQNRYTRSFPYIYISIYIYIYIYIYTMTYYDCFPMIFIHPLSCPAPKVALDPGSHAKRTVALCRKLSHATMGISWTYHGNIMGKP